MTAPKQGCRSEQNSQSVEREVVSTGRGGGAESRRLPGLHQVGEARDAARLSSAGLVCRAALLLFFPSRHASC
jgi:hypothetical protein